MAQEFGFLADMVAQADPVMPKFDLRLGPEGLALCEDFDEIRQGILLRLLMQRGDYRYDRRMGLPWIDHPKGDKTIPLMGSPMDPYNLRRIEVLVMREVFKDPRVMRVDRVEAAPADPLRRRITVEVSATTFDQKLVKLYYDLYPTGVL